jgi:hypothetical protein
MSRNDQDDARQRVTDWFEGAEADGIPERPRRYGRSPAQQDWDVSREWMGAVHKLVMAPQQVDPPRVRLPGDADERRVAVGFRQGTAGVDPWFLEPAGEDQYEPEDRIDLSRYQSF